MPRDREVRRFTIRDSMVLIAALGVGLAWSGQTWRDFQTPSPALWARAWVERVGILGAVVVVPSLVGLALALLALRVAQPRPRWRRAARQPGTTACLAVALSLLVFSPALTLLFFLRGGFPSSQPVRWSELPSDLLEILVLAAPLSGVAVLIAWLLLAVQGGWRNEPSWLDRAGRAIGLAWVAMGGFLGYVLFLLKF